MSQYFNQWDPLTQYLMNDPNQSKALAAIRRALSAGGPYTGAAPYTDPKTVSAVVRDMKGYFTNGTDPSGSNYADAFLGSYQGTWIAVPRNGNTATVYFQANNVTDLNSFAHPEVTTFGAMHSIDGLQTEISFIASIGGLDMYMFRPQSQEFQWQETVNY